MIRYLFIGLFAIGWSSFARADDVAETDATTEIESSSQLRWAYYGFLTQGYTKTTGNNYYGKSIGSGSFDFHELGLGGNLIIGDRTRISGLIMERSAGKNDHDGLRLDYLHADIGVGQWLGGDVDLMLGRVKIPIGFYNETRDVAKTRPSIILPQPIYFENNRRFVINSDGVALNWRTQTGPHSYWFTLMHSAANGVDRPESERAFLGRDWPGELKAKYSQAIRIWYDNDDLGTTAQLVLAANNNVYQPAVSDPLPGGRVPARGGWLSLQKRLASWSITSEIFRFNVYAKGFQPVLPEMNNRMLGWYIMPNWNINQTLEVYARYDEAYIDFGDKQGTKLAAMTKRPAHNFFAKSWMLGGKYHLGQKQELAVEYHWVDGTRTLMFEDNLDLSAQSRYWNVLAAQYTITF